MTHSAPNSPNQNVMPHLHCRIMHIFPDDKIFLVCLISFDVCLHVKHNLHQQFQFLNSKIHRMYREETFIVNNFCDVNGTTVLKLSTST